MSCPITNLRLRFLLALLTLSVISCSTFSSLTPTSTPVPSLAEVANDMLIEAVGDEKSLIGDYYSYISISYENQDLVFILNVYPTDMEESISLAADIIFNGAIAAEVTGEQVDTIVVEYFSSPTNWERFNVSGDYMSGWLQKLTDGTASMDSLLNNINYEVSAAPTPSKPTAPMGYQMDGRTCISWKVAGSHIGEFTCVFGIVTHVFDSSNASFINFSPSNDAFYIVSFDYNFEGYIFEDDCIAALGSIQTYSGTPQIVINYPDTELERCN